MGLSNDGTMVAWSLLQPNVQGRGFKCRSLHVYKKRYKSVQWTCIKRISVRSNPILWAFKFIVFGMKETSLDFTVFYFILH